MKTSKQGIPLRSAHSDAGRHTTDRGIIDDDGSLYMSSLPAQGAITLRWGEAPNQICHIVTTYRTTN
ncbi:FimD/PapC C-terminal domain-containing protein [Escherichia coli]